ncbi:MAG: tetratricopeptide repeat protein [Verrucomicrobiota bacterium]
MKGPGKMNRARRAGKPRAAGLAGVLFFLLPILHAQVFPLSDSSLAVYGVNEAIEPRLTRADRLLYDKVAPLLRDRPEEAIRLVQAGLQADSSPAFHLLIGNLSYQADHLEQAEQSLNRAIEALPSFRRAYRTLGLTHIRQERFKDSIPTWLKVITLGGGDAQSYGLLAYAYLSEEKYASALSAYRMARMFAPDSLDFRRGEARCLLASNQFLPAIALFDELIAEHPGQGSYWLLQANAYLGLERYADAAANLEIARALGGKDAEALLLLGGLYLKLDTPALALDAYRDALSLQVTLDEEKALQPLPWLIARGMYSEAEDYYQALGKPLAGHSRTILYRAQLDLARGRDEAARRQLAELIKTDPMNGPALILLGEAFLAAEKFPEGAFYLERALVVPGSKADALVALARMHVARGRLEQARDCLRQAQEVHARSNIATYLEQVEAALRR